MTVRTARRLGVMGGTFDPIHHGHLVAASEVADVFGLDEVLFVPTGEPVFKQERRVTSAEHRYLMTVVATASNPRFNVSRVDIDRPGLTYTIDTLRDLKRDYPDAELFFITGADVLPEILLWKDVDELWSLAHFIGVNRPGHHLDDTGLPSNGVSLLEVPAMAISSTDCRQRVKRGMPVWYLVPDGVVQYIGKHNLYRGDDVRVLTHDDDGETDDAARDGGDDGTYGGERTHDDAAEPGPDDGTGPRGGRKDAGASDGTTSAAGRE